MHHRDGDHAGALLALRQRQLREQRVGEVCDGLLVCAGHVLLGAAVLRERLSDLGCALLLGFALQLLVHGQGVAADRACVVLQMHTANMSRSSAFSTSMNAS